ncbi:MAG TPA: YtxH domain-containing protein [Anaerolineaceae bacterium]|nr:YtxH domain-containing protein [Anaerolineaceae bacterium]
MSENNEFGSFVAGFAIGALAGAVVSLLMAPQSGEETRRIIKDRAIELKDKGTETFEETKSKAEAAYRDALAKAEELGVTLKHKVDEMKKTATKASETATSKVDEVVAKADKAISEGRKKLADSIEP